jgi:hypothetical protein
MKPWERLEDESSHAYQAFIAYRDATKRSLQSVHSHVTISTSIGQLHTWSNRYNWKDRALAWDRHVSAKRDARILTKLTSERSKLALKRLTARSLAVNQALRTLEKINRDSIAVCEPGELLELLRATRQAFELVGLSQIDFDEQLHRASEAGVQTPQISVSRAEPDPENLLGLPDESDTVQRSDTGPQALLDQTD